jgi:hypothetical protein
MFGGEYSTVWSIDERVIVSSTSSPIDLDEGENGWVKDNYQQRYDRLSRKVRQVVAVGVGLTAFVVTFVVSDVATRIYEQSPGWLGATVLTLALVAGGCLGQAYIRYEREQTVFARALPRTSAEAPGCPGLRWPAGADNWWKAALAFVTLTAIMFLVAIWWPVIWPLHK